MNFDQLAGQIQQTHHHLQQNAITVVNQSLCIRNWLIGYYISEYELKGEDRAEYGDKLFSLMARELKKRQVKGLSKRALHYSHTFYQTYPQFGSRVGNILRGPIVQTVFAQSLALSQNSKIDSYSPSPDLLLRHFSFSHFIELIAIKDPLKRAFYEIEGIKGHWSVRQLRRQIESLLFERTGLSTDKAGLLEQLKTEPATMNIADSIRDPYILEFTGLQEKHHFSESDLEGALLDHIQEFLLELGNGFCFEARQKRITIDNEHDRIDLVFYHRILKCHVLLDLKIRKFSHRDAGQMNFYLNYFRDNMVVSGDNPPVGIILCTSRHETKVKYAIAGLDNQMFVSKYLVQLPSEKELEAFVQADRERIEADPKFRPENKI